MTALLRVRNVTRWFGGNPVLQDISFAIEPGEVVGLIGPNGAGKTTLFNVVTGFLRPKSGDVVFEGRDITGVRPEIISRLGVCRTFQITKPFANIPVLQNVMIGALCRERHVTGARRRAEEVLEFVGLADKMHRLGRNLTISDRKRLELARGLATRPKLFLLDEVMAGLTPHELQAMMALVERIRATGVTLFIIEHVMAAIMTLSDRVIALDYGRMLCAGRPSEVTCNPDVIKAYLGEEYAGAHG